MTYGRRLTVPLPKWNRLRGHLPPAAITAGDAVAPPATVDGYKSSRAYNALALEGALAALLAALVDDLGRPAGDSELGRLLAAAGAGGDSAAEISAGHAPGDRAAARRFAQAAAGELGAMLRRAAIRAETLELGLALRAEDLEADQRVDDRIARVRPG